MDILSINFILFFICFYIGYWVLKNNYKIQNIYLLIANYLLYFLWSEKALLLLILISTVSYSSSLILNTNNKINKKGRRIVLLFNIIFNVLILFIFKYYNFFTSEFCRIVSIPDDTLLLRIVLPLGLSFYIFTTLGYIIDVYRGTVRPETNIINYYSFISFFPLILSGPIERSTTLLPQFSNYRNWDSTLQKQGILQVGWGFFKKLVIADNCATVVNLTFNNYESLPASSLIIGAVIFSIQIYFDFSGYSDIAIGFSKLLGFKVNKNFNYPYFAINISDFWRRWHMSLQRWFTDYIYIPLGGSRCKTHITLLNTFIVFIICGIWHGANWTFIIWGLYNAFLFVPYILFQKGNTKKNISSDTIVPSIIDVIQLLLTFLCITIGWIIFNSVTVKDSWLYIVRCFNKSVISYPVGIGLSEFGITFLLIIITFIMEWCNKHHEFALLFKAPGWVKVVALYVILALIIFCKAGTSDFIYLQF